MPSKAPRETEMSRVAPLTIPISPQNCARRRLETIPASRKRSATLPREPPQVNESVGTPLLELAGVLGANMAASPPHSGMGGHAENR
jgi:hypothetical protein